MFLVFGTKLLVDHLLFRHLFGSMRKTWPYMKLFFVCLYECNGIKLEIAYEQASKTGLKKNISHEKERELDNSQFLRSSSPLKEILAPMGGSKVGYCCLSIEILNILYDRHGPNTGFWCLMSFELLNSKT